MAWPAGLGRYIAGTLGIAVGPHPTTRSDDPGWLMGTDWISRAQSLSLEARPFIDGRFGVPRQGRSIKKFSPRDGRLLCSITAADVEHVEGAVGSSRRAFADGRWSQMPANRRQDTLYRLASLLERHVEELALLESIDVGKPIRSALDFDVVAAAAIIRFNAEAANKHYGKVYSSDAAGLSYEVRRPVGVVAGVIGWNFPLVLAAQKIGPALAAGNSIVLKPSELTSLSASRVAELAMEAGVPEGVLNIIHGDGQTGTLIALHREVDLVTFTGSTKIGKKILIASGQSNMKRVILECGGKAPNIIFDDCQNLDAVAEAVVSSAFWNQGQVCVASSRLLVQESIKDEIVKRVVRCASSLIPEDPLKEETKFGALISQGHRQRVLGYIETGEREGATIIYQSKTPPPFSEGAYVGPIIFDNVQSHFKIAQEEIFGPVLAIISFRDEQDALRIANETIYGLSAVVWTTDLARAHRISRALDAGWIVIRATDKSGSDS